MAAKDQPITAFKGFDKDLKCRDFQYEVGKTYTHDGETEICKSGFHACENPLDVWTYYGPADGRFCVVEQSEGIARHGDDSKIVSAKITIKAEIELVEVK